MCGIVGYSGGKKATPILIEGLKRLEYRGYDSAGIAYFEGDTINLLKKKGRLKNLEEEISKCREINSTCGIGHTRWATHGEPSDTNSHPHLSYNKKLAIVHNGIIENYTELKAQLQKIGYKFFSQTDTEVLSNLLDHYYEGDMLDAIRKANTVVRGSFALGVVAVDKNGEIIATKKDSPLIIGVGENESFIASDIPAILAHTKKYIVLEDYETARLKDGTIEIYNGAGERIEKEILEVTWDIEAAEKGGYEHFMIKEIFEQPKAVRDTINPRIKNSLPDLSELKLTDEQIKNIGTIHIVACGSAYHSGLVGAAVIEKLCRIPCIVSLASEFRYKDPILNKNDLCIIVSQSGETADTLAALRDVRKKGVHVLGIVNVVGSSIARESDSVIYTLAGPEIAVATTKAYSTQIAVFYIIAAGFALKRGNIDEKEAEIFCKDIKALPELIEDMLKTKEHMQHAAAMYYNRNNVFFIGRGVDFSAGTEASLKLKEVSYVHSECYAAGELKHGTISLIEEQTLVISIATQKALYEKMISNIKEVHARGACIMSISGEGFKIDDSEVTVYIPKINELFTPSLSIVPLQLFSYYVAVARNCDVDKPRNLAKSVTVE